MRARLFLLAHGRSGDKGDMRTSASSRARDEWYEFLSRELTAERVRGFLGTLAEGEVERHELPNLSALNFLVHEALGGGGSISLRLDAQGKTYAQALFRMPMEVPPELAGRYGTTGGSVSRWIVSSTTCQERRSVFERFDPARSRRGARAHHAESSREAERLTLEMMEELSRADRRREGGRLDARRPRDRARQGVLLGYGPVRRAPRRSGRS